MPAPELLIRSPETDSEMAAFFRLPTETFIPSANVEVEAARWQRYVTLAPDRDGWHLRGAFRDGAYLGGYVMHERSLRMGAARLRTACIAAVVTHPDHRRQGVASALMRDANTLSQARRCALLLLGGIPGFYDRFGYTDILDITQHAVERAPILAEPPSACSVRPVSLADAPAVLALYQRHYGPYRGSFDWTQAQVAHKLALRLPGNPPLLALEADGRPCGYLIPPWSPEDVYSAEIAADHWPALLALLQHHTRQQSPGPGARDELVWPLPPDSPTFYLLADRLSIRSETHHQPREGWLARPADFLSLIQAMLPEWQARWQRQAAGGAGTFGLAVGDETVVLELGTDGLCMGERPPSEEHWVRLSPPVFTQLLFGFRPAWWAAEQPGQLIPEELIRLVDVLLPPSPTWIAGSDAF